MCSTLQEIVTDANPIPANAQINIVLLQAALDNNSLDAGECYGDVLNRLPNIRFLITKSTEDIALQRAYPDAHRLANLFGNVSSAMSANGPSAAFQGNFAGSAANIAVDVGFSANGVPRGQRLVVADLSSLHQHDGYKADRLTGHHSDVFQPEIYELVFGFLF